MNNEIDEKENIQKIFTDTILLFMRKKIKGSKTDIFRGFKMGDVFFIRKTLQLLSLLFRYLIFNAKTPYTSLF